MSQNYKYFIEKYIKKNSEDDYLRTIFVVGYRTAPNIGKGIWITESSDTISLFTLDAEDKLYLYNKYKHKAEEQIVSEHEKEIDRNRKELEKLKKEIIKKEEELANLTKG